MASRVHESVHRSLVFDRRRSRLVASIATLLPTGANVLDIGCGNGEIGADLTALGHRVVGAEVLQRETCAVPSVLYDGDRLPFVSDSVDWAVLVDVLHHAPRPAQVVQEALRVARRGLVVKDHLSERRFDDLTLSFMDWVGNRQFGVGRDGRYLSAADWSRLWRAAGVREEERVDHLDLYPALAKPFFERGLHFVARLEFE
ncbi:MAG: methyltransferase domain-containing protein [Actinomycetota bacterium]